MKVVNYRFALGTATLAFIVLSGCKGRAPGSQTGVERSHARTSAPHVFNGTARQLRKSEMSEAEIKYGIAPVPSNAVTYQSDVIIVGGGPDVIRSQSDSGFIWTIDASAPHADELKEGDVFFLTNRAVGRILALQRKGDALVVAVGPVDLTEIVSEAHIHIPETPIDLNEAIPYTLSEVPGQQIHVADNTHSSGGSVVPAIYQPQARTIGAPSNAHLLPASEQTNVSCQDKFKVKPTANGSGVGMQVASNGGGLTLSAAVLVHITKPTVRLDLDIAHGLKTVVLELGGAAGLTWKFNAGSKDQVGALVDANDLLVPDTDFVMNFIKDAATAALPLSATFRQRMSVKTALGVRKSTLSATGDYSFKGSFRVGYQNGNWIADAPSNFSANKSLVESTDGNSVAITGIDLGHVLTMIAGVGVAGFTAGPYVSFYSALGVARNSDIGMLPCNSATLKVDVGGGAGYAIPRSITQAINYILKLFGSKKQIAGYGGVAIAKPTTLINTTGNRGGCRPIS
jgi:hypothetical protein